MGLFKATVTVHCAMCLFMGLEFFFGNLMQIWETYYGSCLKFIKRVISKNFLAGHASDDVGADAVRGTPVPFFWREEASLARLAGSKPVRRRQNASESRRKHSDSSVCQIGSPYHGPCSHCTVCLTGLQHIGFNLNIICLSFVYFYPASTNNDSSLNLWAARWQWLGLRNVACHLMVEIQCLAKCGANVRRSHWQV